MTEPDIVADSARFIAADGFVIDRDGQRMREIFEGLGRQICIDDTKIPAVQLWEQRLEKLGGQAIHDRHIVDAG